MTSPVVNIYPDSGYTFQYKAPQRQKDISDLARLQAKYQREGMRRSVGGILMMHGNKHPRVLVLRPENYSCKLPGGHLKPGENEIEGLKRKLSSKLGATSPLLQIDWQIGECVGIWWWPTFEPYLFPYCPPDITEPKVCKKLFMVHLPERAHFEVPSNYKLLPVSLLELYNNYECYGPILCDLPKQLSRFQINLIDT